MQFNFATAQRILFGCGRFTELGPLAAQFGRRICLVTGARSLAASGRLAALEAAWREGGLAWTHLTIDREPTVSAVDGGVRQARGFGAEAVVAIGGGSVIDAGKAMAALLANGGETLDYLEGVGRGQVLTKPALPFIAVPTTAGTGSEATKNAVISDDGGTFKKSLRADGMLPAVALVDPELTADCPLAVGAACGMDALTQLLESFTARRANPIGSTLSGLGLSFARHLARLRPSEGQERPQAETREALAMASLLGGIGLANAGLGAVHGLASPLGAFFPIAHGAICGALLSAVIRVNAERAAQSGDGLVLEKYRTAATQLVGMDLGPHWDPAAQAEVLLGASSPLTIAQALAEQIAALQRWLGLPGLAAGGVRRADFDRIIAEGRAANSMKTNPVDLTDDDLVRILDLSL